MSDFHSELACAMTGADMDSTVAWYKADAAAHMPTIRAAAHWAKATEAERDAIAAGLGISEPFPNDRAWGELPKAIKLDYEQAMERAADRLAV